MRVNLDSSRTAAALLFIPERSEADDVPTPLVSKQGQRSTNPKSSVRSTILPHTAQLLDMITALPGVRRAYECEGVTDEIC
jgi:glutathione S-transferase